MNREQLISYIESCYNADAEHPWQRYPGHVVFRHSGNRKWFALIMSIPESKLGLPGDDIINVLNVKSDPVLIASLLNEKGYYPAYHMNKTEWITVVLDENADESQVKWLLGMSFDLTLRKAAAKK